MQGEGMAKKGKPKQKVNRVETQPEASLGRKEYERELAKLQGELVAIQAWVKSSGAKVCVVFEGRDTAGKGGTIKRITERVSPRVFRVVALPAPTEREKSQMYAQRYFAHLPASARVPHDREIHVIRRSGQRAYYATRLLVQNGFDARVISGGVLSHAIVSTK